MFRVWLCGKRIGPAADPAESKRPRHAGKPECFMETARMGTKHGPALPAPVKSHRVSGPQYLSYARSRIVSHHRHRL